MNISLEAVQAKLETTKQRNNDMEVSLEAVQAELETTKRRNGDMEVSLEAVKTELETMKREIQELKATKRACDSGWISSPEKCYYVSSTSEQTDWSTAKDRCIGLGARLVEIKTDEEANFIMNSLPHYVGTNDLLYTGRRRNDNNKWVFLSNDEEVDTSVRTWADGEPDGGTQRCGCTQDSDDFNMHDCTGDGALYICEIVR